jgi:hypothetical protein
VYTIFLADPVFLSKSVRILACSNNLLYLLSNWNCVIIVYDVGNTKLETLLPRILHTMLMLLDAFHMQQHKQTEVSIIKQWNAHGIF